MEEKKMKNLFSNIKPVALVEFLVPNAGRDVILTVLAWAAYWVVRFIRTLLKKRWTLQAIVKNGFAKPLTWGVVFDILWGAIAGQGHTAPWWLNWIPVAWHWGPVPIRALCLILLVLAFYDAFTIRFGGSLFKKLGIKLPKIF